MSEAEENNANIQQVNQMQMQAMAVKQQIDSLVNKHKNLSSQSTPKPYIETRADGFDYVDEGYMRGLLNEYFPIWNWEIKKYEILGDVEIIVHGRLTIIDEGLPRYFEAVASHRIAKNAKGYVNISNNLKSANTDAFKVAVNRLCNIADDVYRKQLVDYNLIEEQKTEIDNILADIDNAELSDKIKDEVDSLGINSQNYKQTIIKLNKMKESK
tara:strand:- start:215 stop:853 length:639 start_codon:yes stop_codon:yes gene_type:complete